jgi:hypothetical protein
VGLAVQSERGGTSLFFRDPDANLLELAVPSLAELLTCKFSSFSDALLGFLKSNGRVPQAQFSGLPIEQ